MRGGERFAGQFHNPVIELVVTRCEKAALLIVNGMEYRKGCVAAIAVTGEV